MTDIIAEETSDFVTRNGQADVLSIYHAMQQLSDTRRKQGKRYPLPLILTYVLVAKAAGETMLQAIAERIRLRGAWLQEVLPQAGPRFPCAATYSNILRAVDPVQLNQVLMDLLTRARAADRKAGEQSHVALDGKTLRGTQKHGAEDQKKMHQIRLYETGTGVILKEQVVGEKENELSRIHEYLMPHLLTGRIVSADALHTQQAFCLGGTHAEGITSWLRKVISPTCSKPERSFFASRPTIARIGARLIAAIAGMGGWKCATSRFLPNSTPGSLTTGQPSPRSFACVGASRSHWSAPRSSSTASPA